MTKKSKAPAKTPAPQKKTPRPADEYPRAFDNGQRAARSGVPVEQAPVFENEVEAKAWHQGHAGG